MTDKTVTNRTLELIERMRHVKDPIMLEQLVREALSTMIPRQPRETLQ